MINPNKICSPPKPSASQKSPHAVGAKVAKAPMPRKHVPITGSTGTENAPPVITPVPYSISPTPGIAAVNPACHNTMVTAPPAIKGGTKLKTNFRAGEDHKGKPAALALRHIARMPNAIASEPSTSQVSSHARGVLCREASRADAKAVRPMATPPQPGTAVKDPARSIVSRI